MSIIVFLLVLTFLVIIHELGHFITAWIFKVNIEEFGVGFPPKVLTLFKWRGIPFTLNAFPIGGFVRMEGENGSLEGEPKATGHRPQGSERNKVSPFYTKPAWQRLIIILAGPIVNFVFGILAFTIIFMNLGIPTTLPHPVISKVVENSPAAQEGFLVGDELLSIGSQDATLTSVESASQFIQWVKEHTGEHVSITIRRNDQEQTIPVRIRSEEEIPAGEGALGVGMDTEEFVHFPWYEMPGRATVVGVSRSLNFGKIILNSLGTMVSDLVSKGTVPKDVAGPVGIAYEVQKGNLISYGPLAILNFAAMLSVNLAIMNILPIPALDGGRALFILIENVFEKKLRAKLEQHINTVGFVLLLTLIGLITIKDVIGIVSR